MISPVLAWAFTPEKKVILYLDARRSKRASLTKFIRSALADWGRLEAVKPTPIRLVHTQGRYTAWIGQGKVRRPEL